MVRVGCGAILILMSLLASGEKIDFGSDCTTRPITILSTRLQPSAAFVSQPFIFSSRSGAPQVVIGRDKVLELLSVQGQSDAWSANGVKLLVARLKKVTLEDMPIEWSKAYRNFDSLSGETLQQEMSAQFQVLMLFVRALSSGLARVGNEDTSRLVEVQEYLAKGTDDLVRGVRFALNNQVIHDYCYRTPTEK